MIPTWIEQMTLGCFQAGILRSTTEPGDHAAQLAGTLMEAHHILLLLL